MNILLFNTFDCHYECFGFLIDFCKTYNYNIDIFCNESNDFKILDFYKVFFNNYFNIIKKFRVSNDGKISNNSIVYDKIIVVTDDDFSEYFNTIYNKFEHFSFDNMIIINHTFSYRNFFSKNYIAFRYFKNINIDYIYPFYNLISYDDKIKILNNQKTINVCIISKTIYYDYKYYLNNLVKNKNIHINLINRKIDYKQDIYDLYKQSNITIYENSDFYTLKDVFSKSHYMIIPYNADEYKYSKSSGTIELSYNFLCQLIFDSHDFKLEYNLESPIVYHNNIQLTSNIDILKIYNERHNFINKRNNTLYKYLNNFPLVVSKPIINHKIPKIIFQTWESKKLTCILKTLTHSIKKNNPDYAYYLFDNNDRREFIKEHFDNNVLLTYDSIIPGGFKADLWRYCILYIYGGFYCDIDMMCLNGFDEIIKNNEECIFTIDYNNNNSYTSFNLANAFIGIIPQHPIMYNCIQNIVDNVLNEKWKNNNEDILEFSGPGVLGKNVNLYFNRPIKQHYNINNDYHYFRTYNVNLINFCDNDWTFITYTKVIKNLIRDPKELDYIQKTLCKDGEHVYKEFIKTIDNYYLFQNKNGNVFLNYIYNEDIKVYNIKNWTSFSHINLPYLNF